MTTTVKVHVGGRYRAFVLQNDRVPVLITGGNNDGADEHVFTLEHGKVNTFTITEEQRPPDEPAKTAE